MSYLAARFARTAAKYDLKDAKSYAPSLKCAETFGAKAKSKADAQPSLPGAGKKALTEVVRKDVIVVFVVGEARACRGEAEGWASAHQETRIFPCRDGDLYGSVGSIRLYPSCRGNNFPSAS